MTTYRYTNIPDQAPRPYILIGLQYKDIIFPIDALLDSGSDCCICHMYIGESLGISFAKKKKHMIYATNKTPITVFEETITAKIADNIYPCPFYFSENISLENPVILGQRGFFDHFRVTFDLPENVIELSYKGEKN